MGLLQKLNENRNLGLGVAVAIVIVAVGIIALQLAPGSGVTKPKNAFYTDDDGKSFFKDDLKKVPPFDHGGKRAYRADVFRCADGHEFVGLVYRYNTDAGRKEIERYIARNPKDPEGALRLGIEHRQMQVQKPGAGDKAWATNDESYTDSLRASMKCPSGQPAQLVVP